MTRVLFPVWAIMGFFLLAIVSRLALGPTHPPIYWVPWALTPGVKQLGHETDHSSPSGAEVKNAGSYTSTTSVCLHGMVPS